MFRTEVVESKNLKKTTAYKIFNAIAFVVFAFILFVQFFGGSSDSEIAKWLNENYNATARPIILGVAFVIVAVSMYANSKVKNPKRLGTIEIDENEIKYIENDEVLETTEVNQLSSIDFEFFSIRMRGNPVGCMNYLTLNKNGVSKTYEIVVGNAMEAATIGEIFSNINSKVKVNVKYAYWLKKIIKDKNFNFTNE